jgi:hypothetical protein
LSSATSQKTDANAILPCPGLSYFTQIFFWIGVTKAMWWPNSLNLDLHRKVQSALSHATDPAYPDSNCWGEMVDLMVASSNILFIFHLQVSVALHVERKTAK